MARVVPFPTGRRPQRGSDAVTATLRAEMITVLDAVLADRPSRAATLAWFNYGRFLQRQIAAQRPAAQRPAHRVRRVAVQTGRATAAAAAASTVFLSCTDPTLQQMIDVWFQAFR